MATMAFTKTAFASGLLANFASGRVISPAIIGAICLDAVNAGAAGRDGSSRVVINLWHFGGIAVFTAGNYWLRADCDAQSRTHFAHGVAH